MDLNIQQMSNILGVTTHQVHKYISKGHLKALKKEGVYFTAQEDFDAFFENYFLERHSSKGYKTPTNQHIKMLMGFIDDINNPEFTYEAFYAKYHNIHTLIPPLQNFLLIKRNKTIKKERIEKKLSIKDLATKYKLSEASIKKIIKGDFNLT